MAKRKKSYLTNKNLLPEVLISREQDEMTDKLATMLTLLVKRYAGKGNFSNYTYNDDMQAYAMLMLVKTWRGFDPERSQNPFAYFTQCIKNSFRQYLNQEKKQRDVRDGLLVSQGKPPSYSYQIEHQPHNQQDLALFDEEDFSNYIIEPSDEHHPQNNPTDS